MVSAGLAESSADLAAFHVGDRAMLEQCYRDHYRKVVAAASRVVRPVDAETVTQEVFHRLLASPEMRRKFEGGDLGAWLGRVATNQAIDHRRRYAREESISPELAEPPAASEEAPERISAQLVIDRFRRERLPAKWARVFETRFIGQLGQREAARALGMSRTTLMYQEHRIRALLRRFVLQEEA
jgi:RNA polymerase sigma-70 factor, ECF subfamily